MNLLLSFILLLPFPAASRDKGNTFILVPIIGPSKACTLVSMTGSKLHCRTRTGEEVEFDTRKLELMFSPQKNRIPKHGTTIFFKTREAIWTKSISCPGGDFLDVYWRFAGKTRIPIEKISLIFFHERKEKIRPGDCVSGGPGQDILYIKKKEKVIQIPVTIIGFKGKLLEFEFAGERRTMPIHGIKAIKLGGKREDVNVKESDFTALIKTLYNEKLFCKIMFSRDSRLYVSHPFLGSPRILFNQIKSIDFRAGSKIHLTRLKPIKDVNIPAFSRKWPYMVNETVNHNPLKLGNNTYENGFCFLPKRSLTFRVPRGYNVFKALVGIDSETRGTGNASFEVLVDGKRIYQKVISGSDGPAEISAFIGVARTITISAGFGQDMHIGDHCDFIMPRLIKAPLEAGK